jgi:RNA ligase
MIQILNKYYDDGWLIKQTHPTLPLTIWNYSATTQYEGYWDEITLQCRGLVTDDMGNIVARPFKKFFNMEEGRHTSTSEFDVYEKMDGSLIIVFWYDGGWVVASRGSFISEQALSATEHIKHFNNMDMLDTNATYMFELIAKWNRIVVDYGDREELVLLGVNGSDYECTYHELTNVADALGCNVAKKYDGIKDYSTLKEMISDNQEGFVVRFSNGDRMKIKGDEYVRLHRIMTNISTTSVWEVLSGGESMESYLQNVPDEFYDKVRDYEAELNRTFNEWKDDYNQVFDIISEKRPESRKEWATLIKEYDKEYWGVLFKMIDGKDYDELIWKQIKPEYQKL